MLLDAVLPVLLEELELEFVMIRSLNGFGPLIAIAALALTGCDREESDATQESAASQSASEAAAPPPPLPGQVVRAFAGTQLPALTFEDPQGNTLDLGAIDKPVLVNLWATWCAPCRVEMPSLDALAAEMEDEIDVLTISQDIRGAELVTPFYEEQGFEHLEQWLDPENRLGKELSGEGLLPVTILFDAQGKELLRVAGGFEWDSEEAIAQVREAIEVRDS